MNENPLVGLVREVKAVRVVQAVHIPALWSSELGRKFMILRV